ncbi:hypothetical protein [Psychromarinibacter halotolerans]|uniref:DUF1127 domain-containing protein n=1 Tax=Psychromarinibacter halotolerans TaxID=1775175 RepID=A0ABV7GTB0_9RHOB|nr:hypothetical protein [Psychromarinibacter halotolerans]MAQ83459.1 hypothetical protein [Maritimibacter sp.]MDF0594642.1 hypothetical protein [Psychromarinibacter halotolerans]
MTTTYMLPFTALRSGLTNFVRRFGTSGYEDLFSLTDEQLAVRGYTREGLAKLSMSGRAWN